MLAISAGDLGLPLGKGGLDRGTAERVSSGSAGRVGIFIMVIRRESVKKFLTKNRKWAQIMGRLVIDVYPVWIQIIRKIGQIHGIYLAR